MTIGGKQIMNRNFGDRFLYFVPLENFTPRRARAIVGSAIGKAVGASNFVPLCFDDKKCLLDISFNRTGVPRVIV
jgi:hypothetical protein